MNAQDALRAGRDVADQLTDDPDEVERLAGDDLFSAYAFIHQEAGVYQAKVERTAATDGMQQAAEAANGAAYEVAVRRAEELLGRPLDALDDGHRVTDLGDCLVDLQDDVVEAADRAADRWIGEDDGGQR